MTSTLMRQCFTAAYLFFSISAAAWAEVSFETLTFIEADGHTYTNYSTTRSDGDEYTVFLDPSENLSNFLYVNPNRYEVSPESHSLLFEQGSYALINRGDFIDSNNPQNSAVRIDSEGVYHLSTWRGEKQANGHYGFWHAPEPYQNFAAAWIIPAQFEILDYHSNQMGEWVRRGNTLAFFANQVNNLVFDIRYRRVSESQFTRLKRQLAEHQAVELENTEAGLKVILTNNILFDSGSATLSPTGNTLLAQMIDGLDNHKNYHLIVEGHTDDIPIRGALQQRFASNWELSAQRALNVVHVLVEAGLDPKQLQARAFGPHRPRVENSDANNRARNRRIELIIEPTT